MVFHAEALRELSCIALLADCSTSPMLAVITFLLNTESALPAVNEPPTDVLSSLPLLLCCCARSLPNCRHLSAGVSIVVHARSLALLHSALHVHGNNATPTGKVFAMIAFL